MGIRQPKQPKPCRHDVAQWKTVDAEHQMRCVACQHIIEREFGVLQRKLGVQLDLDVETGIYKAYNPKGWM
jgi:hypothetical protein